MPDHPMDVITSYVEEKCCFGNTKIHVVYLGLKADVVGRNEKTAECFRGLCKAAEGRLHWIRESGGQGFFLWFSDFVTQYMFFVWHRKVSFYGLTMLTLFSRDY